ncbi:MAG: LytTR family DNA-binding domain-containing protein [Sediminibacterium sp.]
MIIKCLIIDDEPIARQILENYCSLLPQIEVLGSCSNALEATQIIESQQVDLIFLDINMPVLDGLSFMKTLSDAPQIILTTAYKEYAHQAFDLAACDYLLKPFSLDRFIVAVDRANKKLQTRTQSIENLIEDFTYIKTEGKLYRLNFKEIKYAEAAGNNVKIVSDTGILTPPITFKALEILLPKPKFIRLHRSFLINKDKISLVEGHRVFIGSVEIPIGPNYKELFFRQMGFR